MMTLTFRNHRGDEHDYDAAVLLMDDDLREKLYGEITPCTNQEFMVAYAERHLEKFGEGFPPYHDGEW